MAVKSNIGIKRITALTVAVMLPIMLIFTGCGKRLTEQEYADGLYAVFKEYLVALEEIENVRSDVSSSQEIMLEQTKATEICQNAEKVLKKFDKMNPPEKFSDKHKTLLAAVEYEKEFVRASQKVLTARTPFEYEQYSIEAAMVFAGVPEEQQFGAVLTDIILEIKNTSNSE